MRAPEPRISKRLNAILGGLAVLSFAAGCVFGTYLGQFRPQLPDVASGYTHQLASHGVIVYVSAIDYAVLIGLFSGMFICGLIYTRIITRRP